MTENLALKAAQGLDTHDLLNHIAWTDVIKPKLEEAKALLTKQLVEVTLNPPVAGNASREQIAGKLWGIDYLIGVFERILRDGMVARDELAKHNMFLQ